MATITVSRVLQSMKKLGGARTVCHIFTHALFVHLCNNYNLITVSHPTAALKIPMEYCTFQRSRFHYPFLRVEKPLPTIQYPQPNRLSRTELISGNRTVEHTSWSDNVCLKELLTAMRLRTALKTVKLQAQRTQIFCKSNCMKQLTM